MLTLRRTFLLPNKSSKVSFEFKVDGASCRKGSESCSQGLHFYINGRQVLKSDTQFHWKYVEYPVEKVRVKIVGLLSLVVVVGRVEMINQKFFMDGLTVSNHIINLKSPNSCTIYTFTIIFGWYNVYQFKAV